jgi:anti-anti-sigma regulatory factor
MRAVSVALRAFRKPDVALATLRWDDTRATQSALEPRAVLALTGSPSLEALVSLRRAATRAVAAGHKTIRVDIDELAVLDSAVIATLILLLRGARQSGASVVLRASRENIVGTLQATALDKVFVIETPTATTLSFR